MTHQECIASVIARVRRRPIDVPAARVAEAEEHLADCSDCWTVVELLHEVALDGPPPERRMQELFGCDDARDRFHVCIGLTAQELLAREPVAARHLSWCEPCRIRFVELAAVEREFGFAPDAVSPAAPAPAIGARFAARLTIAVRRGLAGFTRLEGALAIRPLVPLPVRGDERPPDAMAETVRIGDDGAEITVRRRGDASVDLEIRFRSEPSPGGVVWLRAADGGEPIACRSIRPGEAVVLSSVPTGRYVVELPGSPPARVAVVVEPLDG